MIDPWPSNAFKKSDLLTDSGRSHKEAFSLYLFTCLTVGSLMAKERVIELPEMKTKDLMLQNHSFLGIKISQKTELSCLT